MENLGILEKVFGLFLGQKREKKNGEYLGSPKVNQENIAGTRKNEGSPESFWVLRKVFPNLAGAPLGKLDLEKPFRRTQKPFWGNRNFDWWRQFFLIYLLESTSSPVFSRFWPKIAGDYLTFDVWKLSHLNLFNSLRWMPIEHCFHTRFLAKSSVLDAYVN